MTVNEKYCLVGVGSIVGRTVFLADCVRVAREASHTNASVDLRRLDVLHYGGLSFYDILWF